MEMGFSLCFNPGSPILFNDGRTGIPDRVLEGKLEKTGYASLLMSPDSRKKH